MEERERKSGGRERRVEMEGRREGGERVSESE
jgi:hypothetical protein